MSIIILKIRQELSVYLLFFFLKMKAYNFCAIVILLNIRKIKKIKCNTNKNLKRVLVFPKSGGIEDLFTAYKGIKRNNIIFYSLPRGLLKGIHLFCFKDIVMRDYFTKTRNKKQVYSKTLYINILTKIFNSLNKFINFDCLLSFNVFYYAEKYLDDVCINLNKKFIILHKESTFTPIEENGAYYIYKRNNDKSSAHGISVYSESQKKILIKSNIVDSKKITANGCPRSDYAFKLRQIKPYENYIVFYLIEKKRGLNLDVSKKNNNWNLLYSQTLKFILEFAKKNPHIKLILKGKTGVHKDLLKVKYLSNNCQFVDGGTGEKFLRYAKVIIAFNSTIVFEAIASNRNLIIPNFNNECMNKLNFIYKIKNKKYFVNSKSELFNKINFYLKSKYKKNNLNIMDKKLLRYYLGNEDGKSSKKLRFFLKKLIN
jgi:hypothetical protein